MDPIEEIKSRLDIVDIVSESGVQLRRSGRSYTGLCPFHSNTRTPSFVVFPETQGWHCFGACAEGGDVFSFVMKKYGWDFREALEQLAKRTGVQLEERKPSFGSQDGAESHLHDLIEAAADYFHQLFLHAPQAEPARQYVAKRGLTDTTIGEFQIGFALEAWDACRTHFMNQGYKEQEMLDVGLLTENPENFRRYDRFRNRLIIPIRDGNGRVVGFGARTLDPDGLPKYLNSPQTHLFDKSHLLYGFDMAKRHIREARQVVIVEGYMDVIQAWQAGFRNVVAQMGTALTEEQLHLLKRVTKRFVIALDADAAGAKATLRGLEVARQTLDREVEVLFNPRGLTRHEGRLQADIRIVTLPPGDDPDSIIRRTPELWPRILERAKPVVEYVIGVLTADLDLSDIRAKEEIAKQIRPLIEDVASVVERDHYWQMLGRVLGVDDKLLRQIPSAESRRTPPPPTPSAQQAPPPKTKSALLRNKQQAMRGKQSHFLTHCLFTPALLGQVDALLEEHGEPPVAARDFANVEEQVIFAALRQQPDLVQGNGWRTLDGSLHQRLEGLLSQPPTAEPSQIKLIEALVLSVLDWRAEKLKQFNKELGQLLKEQSDPESITQYAQQNAALSQHIRRLDKARGALSAMAKRQLENRPRR